MSLNNNKLKQIDSSKQEQQERVPAKFYSKSIQDQINQMREDISLLTAAVDKLIELHEKEHAPTNTSTDHNEHDVSSIKRLKVRSPYI
jgi:hypothetical protein